MKGQRLRVEVTRKDIEQSKREIAQRRYFGNRSFICPIAQSLRRKGYGHVCVDGATASLSKSEGSDYGALQYWLLSSRARDFIQAFDSFFGGGAVEPSTFYLTRKV